MCGGVDRYAILDDAGGDRFTLLVRGVSRLQYCPLSLVQQIAHRLDGGAGVREASPLATCGYTIRLPTVSLIQVSSVTERRMAFENLANRVKLDAVKGVVTTMIQTEKYGTPLASALRVLSAEFRHERMMRAEEKAARLPAIMTVPLILFILPTLFVVILGPAACSISTAF